MHSISQYGIRKSSKLSEAVLLAILLAHPACRRYHCLTYTTYDVANPTWCGCAAIHTNSLPPGDLGSTLPKPECLPRVSAFLTGFSQNVSISVDIIAYAADRDLYTKTLSKHVHGRTCVYHNDVHAQGGLDAGPLVHYMVCWARSMLATYFKVYSLKSRSGKYAKTFAHQQYRNVTGM
jgi:hypothetical protein